MALVRPQAVKTVSCVLTVWLKNEVNKKYMKQEKIVASMLYCLLSNTVIYSNTTTVTTSNTTTTPLQCILLSFID